MWTRVFVLNRLPRPEEAELVVKEKKVDDSGQSGAPTQRLEPTGSTYRARIASLPCLLWRAERARLEPIAVPHHEQGDAPASREQERPEARKGFGLIEREVESLLSSNESCDLLSISLAGSSICH